MYLIMLLQYELLHYTVNYIYTYNICNRCRTKHYCVQVRRMDAPRGV